MSWKKLVASLLITCFLFLLTACNTASKHANGLLVGGELEQAESLYGLSTDEVKEALALKPEDLEPVASYNYHLKLAERRYIAGREFYQTIDPAGDPPVIKDFCCCIDDLGPDLTKALSFLEDILAEAKKVYGESVPVQSKTPEIIGNFDQILEEKEDFRYVQCWDASDTTELCINFGRTLNGEIYLILQYQNTESEFYAAP